MRALVVYESMFGNTRDLALAVVDGLAAGGALVDLVPADSAPDEFPDRVDLLVVGAPTHALSLPKPQTRAEAARRVGDGELIAGRPGVREWAERVHLAKGQPTATFDTKMERPRLPGSAARVAARRLRNRGATIIGTRTFHVTDVQGPLAHGEIVQARAWAGELMAQAAVHRVG